MDPLLFGDVEMSEITITDWIAATAATAACIATFILAFIALKQSSISNRQTGILQDQADIFARQAGYQGQQTTISKRQVEIAEKQIEIARQQLDSINYQEKKRQEEKTRQQTELLTAFKRELIDNYRESGYNGLHAVIEPGYRTTTLKNAALEELLKKGFAESWNKESKEKIDRISQVIKDINRAISYKDRLDPINEPEKFTAQNRVIKEESNELEHYIFLLSKEKLDGLGEFLP